MNWKSVIGLGILLWVLIFVEISVVMFTPALAGKEAIQKVIHLIILPVLVLICGRLYFKGKKLKNLLKEGLLVGIWWLIVGTILDLVITVPLFTGLELFAQWNVWLGYSEVLVFAVISAAVFRKK